MGKLKEHFHDEITRGLHMDDMVDADYRYDLHKEQLAMDGIPEDVEQYEADRAEAEKAHAEEIISEEEYYLNLAEQHKFMATFETTGHYPM